MNANLVRSEGKQTLINVVSQVLSFAVNIAIGFFLTPYLVKHVGATAYGFLGLANNFVSYIQIFTAALNSMAGRFIAVHFYKDDFENVNKYYSSVLISNVVISAVLTIPCTLTILFMNKLFDVPANILSDVRLLWAFTFLAMFASIIGGIYNNAAYVKNRLELVSLRTVESYIIKALMLVGMFAFLSPKVWYIGLTSFVCTFYVIIRNIYYTKALMPTVQIKRKFFEIKKVLELTASGVWNSISQLGNVLSTGLDLLITNLFVGAGPMGIVSISKTLPTYVSSLFLTAGSVFAPQFTISFAKGDKKSLVRQMSTSMKIMAMFTSIPIAIFLTYGKAFYKLWVPSQNAQTLMWLTLAVLIEYPVSLIVYPVTNVFASANKLKFMCIVTLVTASLSCGTVFVLLKFVKSDFYKMLIVVGTSTIFNLIKNGIFVPNYAGKILGISPWFIYKIVIRNLITTAMLIAIAVVFSMIWSATSWIRLIIVCAVIAVLGILINFFCLLGKNDRTELLSGIKKKLSR